jgi:hypothetical protein
VRGIPSKDGRVGFAFLFRSRWEGGKEGEVIGVRALGTENFRERGHDIGEAASVTGGTFSSPFHLQVSPPIFWEPSPFYVS